MVFEALNKSIGAWFLFPISLKERAKSWLHSLRPYTISTWQEMTREFLKKIFPTHQTNTLRRNIMNFSQKENETFFFSVGRDLKSCYLHAHITGMRHGELLVFSMMACFQT